MDIDLVYMWVDGNDPAWLAKKMATTGEFREGSEMDSRARYVDNEELRYSLRSAEKFAPWIRRIYIITDGQIPQWLDTSNPRVRVVDHSEILPEEALPCFNSMVLEYFLYRIQGLAEHFLYANDDMFFGAPTSPDFFFDAEDGYPIVRLKRKVFGKFRWRLKQFFHRGVGPYRQSIVRAAELVESLTGRYYSGIPHHNIDAYRRSDYAFVVEEVFAHQVGCTKTNRTRSEDDLQRIAFSFYPLAVGHAHLKYVSGYGQSAIMSIWKPDFEGVIRRARPSLFCLNDDQWVADADRARVKPFLEALFPNKSAFEK